MFFCTRKTEQSELCSDVAKLSKKDTSGRRRLIAKGW